MIYDIKFAADPGPWVPGPKGRVPAANFISYTIYHTSYTVCYIPCTISSISLLFTHVHIFIYSYTYLYLLILIYVLIQQLENPYKLPLGGGNNNNNNNNYNNNAVLVARGGGESQIPAINPRALRDGRKGDPLHKCCGKKQKVT